MLAYVFWHWPRQRIEPQIYERRLVDFHQALAENPPSGFRRSVVYRVHGAPGLGERRGYEDWYVVDDWAALGSLNAAAVSGPRQAPHDRSAALAADGMGGLYRLVAGASTVSGSRWAAWFAKPAGTTYAGLAAELEHWTSQPGYALWQRQMVLGPPPEFVLIGPEALELPVSLAPLAIALDPVWC